MILAQFSIPQDRVGEDLLRGAVQLSQDTAQSWNKMWVDLISPNNDLWRGLCNFGIAIAAISLIFVGLKIAAENARGNTFLSEFSQFIIWSIVIFFLLTGNGFLLSQSVVFIRDIGHSQVVSVLDLQLTNLSFRQALQTVALTNAGQDQIEAILAQCQGQGSLEFSDCVREQQAFIEQVIQDVEAENGGPLQGLRDWVSNLVGNMSTFVASIPYSLIKSILYSLQWAFVNILEASLIMTATLAPVAVGLSLLPIGSRALWAWGTGFIGLFAIQLGYNIIVGIAASVVVNTQVYVLNELGFLTFISIFAPGLALLLGGGGGIALYQGLNRAAVQLSQYAMNATAGLTKSLVKMLVP